MRIRTASQHHWQEWDENSKMAMEAPHQILRSFFLRHVKADVEKSYWLVCVICHLYVRRLFVTYLAYRERYIFVVASSWWHVAQVVSFNAGEMYWRCEWFPAPLFIFCSLCPKSIWERKRARHAWWTWSSRYAFPPRPFFFPFLNCPGRSSTRSLTTPTCSSPPYTDGHLIQNSGETDHPRQVDSAHETVLRSACWRGRLRCWGLISRLWSKEGASCDRWIVHGECVWEFW